MPNSFLNNTDTLWAKYEEFTNSYHGGYFSGISPMDDLLRITDGSLTVFVGRPGEGKTTFLNYWLFRLAHESNLKTLYLSFETPIAQHMDILLKYYSGREDLEQHCAFRIERLPNTLENIYNTIKANVEHNNVKLIVIDPFNQIEGVGDDNNMINDALNKIRRWSIDLNVAIIVSHHVPKGAAKVNVQNAYGSYMFNSICDNAMSIESDFERSTATISTQKVRYDGENGKAHSSCTLLFDRANKSYSYPGDESAETDYTEPSVADREHEEVTPQPARA